MLKHFLKISTIILLISFCYVSVNYIGQTNAFFSDKVTLSNTLTAGVLDMTLSNAGDFSPEVTPSQATTRNISVINNGTLGFKYKIGATNISGALCNDLHLEAKLDGTSKYSGDLTSLDYNVGEFFAPEDWEFIVTLTNSDLGLQGQTCNFDFVFEAWQTNFPNSSQGFTDTEQISNTIASGHWEAPTQKENMADHLVISEVCGDDDGPFDFIELYNPTDSPVNLDNWSIQYRAAGGTTIYKNNLNGSISPNKFYLIAKSGVTPTPDNVWLRNLSQSDGNVLLVNDQEDVTGPDDPNIVDKVAYGTGDWPETSPAPSPGATKSIERKSGPIHEEDKGNGYDTDDNSNDFILRDIPEPQNSSSPLEQDCPEIVLNEFLPNADQFPEYIELYNKGDELQDVNGWKIKLSNDTEIIISGDILYGNETSTNIGAEGSGTEWLAIDLSKIGLNILDDTSDTIYLYNENGDKKDEISYPLGSGSNSKPTPGEENETNENISPPDKSFARYPDGTGNWIDPYPTPGGPNKLEEEPEIIDDQQDTTPLPQDSPEEPQITEDGDSPDETADEEAAEEDSDTENEGDPTTETEEEPATEESDDEILPTEEPTDQAGEETPADEEPTVDETVVEEEPSIVPEETTIADGDVGVESDGDDGGGDGNESGSGIDGDGESDTE